MSRNHVRALGAEGTPDRRLPGRLLAGLLALAGLGLAPRCSPAGSEPIQPSPPSATAHPGDADDVATGKQLFTEQCSTCHAVTAGPPKLGPNLEGVLRRQRLHTGRPATEPIVREIILEGSGAMRAFRDSLTDAQLDALITYLKTL